MQRVAIVEGLLQLPLHLRAPSPGTSASGYESHFDKVHFKKTASKVAKRHPDDKVSAFIPAHFF
jgi:hypothetical protein